MRVINEERKLVLTLAMKNMQSWEHSITSKHLHKPTALLTKNQISSSLFNQVKNMTLSTLVHTEGMMMK